MEDYRYYNHEDAELHQKLIYCPEDGFFYFYQDFVEKIFLESIGGYEKKIFNKMEEQKMNEQNKREEAASSIQELEDIDLCSEKLARKHKHEKKRKRKGFTCGNYKRYDERKMKHREAFAEKKEQDKWTCGRLADRDCGGPEKLVTKISAKEAERNDRKNADEDLTNEEMNFCGEAYEDLIYHRDVNEAQYREHEKTESQLSCQEDALLVEIEGFTVKLSALKSKLKDVQKRRKHTHEDMECHKKLYEMYKDMVINEVLGIED